MPKSDPDADIVALLRSPGDRERGASLLVERHGGRIARLVGSIVPSVDRDDVVQEAFVKVIEKIDTHDGRGRFAGWITVVATNQAHDLLRRRRKTVTTPVDAIDLERLLTKNEGTGAPEVDREALIDCIRRQFERFATDHPEHGKALFLFHFLKWDQRAIAMATGRSHEAARKFVSDSRKRLKPYIAPCLDDPEPDPERSDDIRFDRWLERLRDRLDIPAATATEREADAIDAFFRRMLGDMTLAPPSRHAIEAGLMRALARMETRRSLGRRLLMAASVAIAAGAGGTYWMLRRSRSEAEVIEASADFETRFVVRGARTRIWPVDEPEKTARELATSARVASVPYRLRREKADWIVDLFVAKPREPLTTALSRLGLVVEPDRPAITLRFVGK